MKSAAAALDSCKRNGKLLLTNWRDQVKWQVYCDSNYRSAIFFQNVQINYANLKYSLPRHQSQSQPVSHQSSQMLWPSSPFPPLYSSAVNYVVVHLYRRKLWAFIAFRIVFLSLPVTASQGECYSESVFGKLQFPSQITDSRNCLDGRRYLPYVCAWRTIQMP